MRNFIFLCIILAVSALDLKAQSDTLFSEFISLFPGKMIDTKYQSKFMGVQGPFTEQRAQFENRRAKKIISRNENYLLLSVKYNCGAGGTCGAIELYSLSPKGGLISKIDYSEDYGDCGFNNSIEPVYETNELFILRRRNWEGDCLEETTKSEDVEMLFYYLEEKGNFELVREQKINLERQFYTVSTERLTKDELLKKSLEELSEMRNELFASYGYIFKTDKWKSYFESFEWYKPITQSVSKEELTTIERDNLELLIEVEELKK
jgi:hypothetical protein